MYIINKCIAVFRISDAYESLRHEFTKDDSDLMALLSQDGKTSMRDAFFEERDRGLSIPPPYSLKYVELPFFMNLRFNQPST